MKGKGNLLIVFVVVALVCGVVNDDAVAQEITVSPTDPIIAVGQTRQFTATGITSATAVTAGAFHTCALLGDTTLRCWGFNDYGQLGNGTIADPWDSPSPTPAPVVDITGAVEVTGGGLHTCARLLDGTLRCWGRSSEGQLGDPATTGLFLARPVPVIGITTATAVTAGGYHSCALLENGTVRCWGLNDYGQLGNGTVSPSLFPQEPTRDPALVPNATPSEVVGITTATAVSAGGFHTCALLRDGTVRCWGQNDFGQLGDGSTTSAFAPILAPRHPRPTPIPVTVRGITTAVALESGVFHTCALLEDGTMQCWGWNDYFQLGERTSFWQLGNSPVYSSTPVTVPGITPAALAPGAEHTCVLLQDGRVNCWGDNTYGQNGNGSPANIFAPPTAAVTGITNATVVASGAEHSCALLPGGTVQCWGRGDFGRLGNGTTTNAFTPVTVVGLGATWTSSDPAVATIDASGLATGRAPGVTTIEATSDGRRGSTTLTVQ